MAPDKASANDYESLLFGQLPAIVLTLPHIILAPHSIRLFTIHVEPDKYDFERGRKYRICKEYQMPGQHEPQQVYCTFTLK